MGYVEVPKISGTFELVIDHHPLVPILNSYALEKLDHTRLLRSRLKMQRYSFVAHFCVPGKQNFGADTWPHSLGPSQPSVLQRRSMFALCFREKSPLHDFGSNLWLHLRLFSVTCCSSNMWPRTFGVDLEHKVYDELIIIILIIYLLFLSFCFCVRVVQCRANKLVSIWRGRAIDVKLGMKRR